MKHLYRWALAAILAVLVLPGLAIAQTIDATSAVDPLALLSQALAMGPAGIALGVAALLVGLVQLVRRFGGALHPALGTARAAAITSLALAVLGSLATVLATGAPITLATVVNAILLGLTASGLFGASKAIVSKAEKAGDLAVIRETQTKAAQLARIGESPEA